MHPFRTLLYIALLAIFSFVLSLMMQPAVVHEVVLSVNKSKVIRTRCVDGRRFSIGIDGLPDAAIVDEQGFFLYCN